MTPDYHKADIKLLFQLKKLNFDSDSGKSMWHANKVLNRGKKLRFISWHNFSGPQKQRITWPEQIACQTWCTLHLSIFTNKEKNGRHLPVFQMNN